MKKTILMVACFFAAITAYGQDNFKLPEVVPPSPTVASLMAFEEVPIDYYSGQPNIVIPMYSKNIGNGIALNLALRYTTTGVQIDNRSGWVGTGWALETGGVISRTVRGLPDNEYGANKGAYNNPDFWNYDNLNLDQKTEYMWNVAQGYFSTKYDNQLDLYQYSLLGKSGRFVVVKNGTSFEAKLLSKDDNVKIDVTADTYGKISSFLVTDSLGNKYTFDIIESTESIPVNATLPQSPVGVGTIASGSTFNSRTAWHINTVKTSNNIVLATFTYSPHTHTYEVSKTRTKNTLLTSTFTSEALNNNYNNSIFKPREIISHYAVTAQTKKPLKIIFKDGSYVDFSASNSHPETFGAVLNSISIKDKWNVENKKFNLTYENTDRLWLTKVSEVGGSLIQNTDLEYNDKSNLPAYGTGSDMYGYNDGSDPIGTFDVTAIQKGLLKKISYPTGGNKQFTFEHNMFSYERNQSLTNDDYYELNPTNTSMTNSSLTYTINSSNGLNYTLGNNTVVIDFDQTVSIDNNITIPSNVAGSVLLYAVVEKAGFQYKEVLQPQGTNSVFLEAGTYTFKIEVVSLTLDSYIATGTAKLYHRNQSTPFIQAALGGGVRIAEVSFWEDANAIKASRRIYYDYNEPGTTKSSGAIDAIGAGRRKQYDQTVTKSLFLYPDPDPALNETSLQQVQVSYRIYEEGPNAQLTKGNYVGYKRVRAFELGNGYTDYEYTTAYDFPTALGTLTFPFLPGENLDYKRGNLLSQKVYGETGKIVTETLNSYNYVSEVIAPSLRFYNNEDCAFTQFYASYSQYVAGVPYDPYVPVCFNGYKCPINQNCGSYPTTFYAYDDDLTTGWVQLIESKTRSYYDGNEVDYNETRQTFAYNDVNFLQKESNTYIKEKGVEQHYKSETIYPVGNSLSDFTTQEQTYINGMVALNKINVPLLIKTSENGVVTNRVKNIYESFYTNVYEVKKVVTSKKTDPYEDRLQYHGYYDNGMIKEVSKEDGTHIVYIWGYDQTVPVAKIENATYSQVASYVANIHTKSNADNDATIDTRNATGTITSYIGNEGALRSALNNLRVVLPDALITTFTYDPLKGVTSVTDPRGDTVYYFYDSMNRLEYVKDTYGKILSKNEYHYKN